MQSAHFVVGFLGQMTWQKRHDGQKHQGIHLHWKWLMTYNGSRFVCVWLWPLIHSRPEHLSDIDSSETSNGVEKVLSFSRGRKLY